MLFLDFGYVSDAGCEKAISLKPIPGIAGGRLMAYCSSKNFDRVAHHHRPQDPVGLRQDFLQGLFHVMLLI